VPLQRHIVVGKVAVVGRHLRCIGNEKGGEESAEAWKQQGQIGEPRERDLQAATASAITAAATTLKKADSKAILSFSDRTRRPRWKSCEIGDLGLDSDESGGRTAYQIRVAHVVSTAF
jgi:hypothetical protein